jgi:hypothetical protein
MQASPIDQFELDSLRQRVASLDHLDLRGGGAELLGALLDEIHDLYKIAHPIQGVALSNLKRTATRQLLRRLHTVDRSDEAACKATFQLVWLRLLPVAIAEAKENPELATNWNQFCGSNDFLRSPIFDLLGERALQHSKSIESDA